MSDLDREPFCYLTTTGRRTGRPHTIEIWFAAAPGARTLYLVAETGDRADWIRNLRAEPRVVVRVGRRQWHATARVVPEGDEADAARRLVTSRNQGWRPGTPLPAWAVAGLPVAIDLPESGKSPAFRDGTSVREDGE